MGIKKIIVLLLSITCTLLLYSCYQIKEEIYIVKTYEKTLDELIEEYMESSTMITKVTYYEMSDGTWKTDDYTYKYRLILKGKIGTAEINSSFVVLSNTDDITFEQAWKASGLSSNTDDYFDAKDAIIVGYI